MGKLSKFGLQKRTLLFVGIGQVLILGAFALIAVTTIEKSADVILRERLSLARTVAAEIDIRIEHIKAEIIRHGQSMSLGPGGALDPVHEENLRSFREHLTIFHRFVLPIGILAVSPSQKIIYTSETFDSDKESRLAGYLLAAAAGGKASATAASGYWSSGEMSMLFLAPIAGDNGGTLGTLATAVIPTIESPGFSLFRKRGNQSIELVDLGGRVLLGSSATSVNGVDAHGALINEVLASQGAGVKTHPLVVSGETNADHIIAFAPLAELSWVVVVEESGDAALWLPRALRNQVLVVSLSALLVSLAVSWFVTRAVARPLEELTARCRRISGGDLETPVDVKGRDEVGVLARSFEVMRIDLRDSLERIRGWGKELEEKVKQRTRDLEERDKERDLLVQKILVAQEEERKRVARDLHDVVGQSLTALTFSAYAAEEAIDKDPARAAGHLRGIRSLVDSTTEELRHLISDLRPSVLDDLGLLSALRWSVETRLGAAGIKATVEAQGLEERLAPHVELPVFRIVQEALNNIVRHARAGKAEVRLSAAEGRLKVTISDDGIGFDPRRQRAESAVGLIGMEERVTRLGGRFTVESAAGQGTTVRFEVPYERREGNDRHDVNTGS